MNRWRGKVAIVTGASSGIGAAVVKALATAGMVTVGLARRVERVEALRKDLSPEAAGRLHSLPCDVTREESILSAFATVQQMFDGVDVLINNAGISRDSVTLVTPGNTDDLRAVLDTNVLGLVLCAREAFNSMRARGVDGHIINVNSILGHKYVPFPNLNLYGASKYAVTAITETLRNDFRDANTRVKVTSISPGIVRTEMLPEGDQFSAETPMLEAEDVANAILYALGTPPHVQVHEIIIKPVGELV
ncbi:3-oxoacyl-[acyl-carrier-protein] reductase 1 [Anopheles darlingi]|uniref:3-oxoacyl-[acyl-carrier-protein] reductase 1 n=1 Tax=Anopheles darlingi TaxID=43151 RepID=W5JT61_ANODA|nr:3-oxoacyl-[acyl-carrier-protein] reductase 1 [Anopheles darlingi]